MAAKNATKDTSINIRATRQDIDLIDRAARTVKKTRSDFMLEAATRTAEDVMFNTTIYSLSADEWNEYIAAIDSPPAPTAALRRLVREPAPWE